jgi:hypothetical protein
MVSPAPGSRIGGAVTFTWTPGSNVAAYQLSVGQGPGGGNLFSQYMGSALTATTGNLSLVFRFLPCSSPIYVRLYSLVHGRWYFNDYVYYPTPCDG